MPHIRHTAAVFAVFVSSQRRGASKPSLKTPQFELRIDEINEALNALPESHRRHLVGPNGGANGWFYVAVLPQGLSQRSHDVDETIAAVRSSLEKLDGFFEMARIEFGGDGGPAQIRYVESTTDGDQDGS